MDWHHHATVFETVADAIGDATACFHGDRTATWAELDDRAARLAGHLAERGVRPGSCVGFALRNGVELLEALLAIAKAGAVAANVNYRYGAPELHYVLSDCAATALIAEAPVVDTLAPLRQELPSLRCVVSVGSPTDDAGVDDFAVACAADPLPRTARSGDDHVLIYTGGTTGSPKATQWRHAELLRNWMSVYDLEGLARPESLDDVAAAARAMAARADRRIVLGASPLIHGTGFNVVLPTLVVGGAAAFLTAHRLDAAEVWSTVERRRVTAMVIVGDAFAVPLLDELRAARALGREHDVSSLRSIVSAGVTWSAGVKAGLLEFANATLTDLLAASEGGPFALEETTRRDDAVTSRFRLLPTARVIRDDGTDVEPGSGEIGLLASRAPMPDGYLGDPQKSALTWRTLDDGERYAVPGDQALLDTDGTITFLGRASSVINTGGEKVFAEEVESALATHPDVSDVLVVPAPDPRWGSIVAAVVVTRDGTALDEDELDRHVTAQLARYKRPRKYVFVPEVRRSPAGKADRAWATAVVAR